MVEMKNLETLEKQLNKRGYFRTSNCTSEHLQFTSRMSNNKEMNMPTIYIESDSFVIQSSSCFRSKQDNILEDMSDSFAEQIKIYSFLDKFYKKNLNKKTNK